MESDSHTLSTALLIEDFPLLATAFQEALRSQYARIIHAQNHERAVELVTTNPVDRPFAVALLHERICTGPDGGQSDGFSLALLLREHSPETKLVYSISNVSSYKVGSIIREINPEILLYLPDITQVELSTALLRLREGETYASHSVIPHMRNEISSGRCVDITDRRILYFLGQGARTKDLPRLVALSLPSIEKRKRLLKHLLNEPENDYQLILAARRQGLI